MDEIKPPPAVTAPETPRRPQLTPLAVQLIASLKRMPPEARGEALASIQGKLAQNQARTMQLLAQKLAESKD